jgi:hypothetical protein
MRHPFDGPSDSSDTPAHYDTLRAGGRTRRSLFASALAGLSALGLFVTGRSAHAVTPTTRAVGESGGRPMTTQAIPESGTRPPGSGTAPTVVARESGGQSPGQGTGPMTRAIPESGTRPPPGAPRTMAFPESGSRPVR